MGDEKEGEEVGCKVQQKKLMSNYKTLREINFLIIEQAEAHAAMAAEHIALFTCKCVRGVSSSITRYGISHGGARGVAWVRVYCLIGILGVSKIF